MAERWARSVRDLAYECHPRLAEWLSVSAPPGGYVNFRVVDRELASALMTNSSRAKGGMVTVSAGSHEAADAAGGGGRGGGAFRFATLGTVRSCFPEKHGTPRQGAVVPGARATFTLRPDIHDASLDGLAEFSHVWLVFVFHVNNTNGTFSAKVKPPRLRGGKIGAYACRTPHRLNPIGLTVARLDRVENGTLHLSGADLVSGTPVLDVKPYHPNDVVPGARYPQWLVDAPYAPLRVEFSARAEAQLAAAVAGVDALEFYDTAEEARRVVSQVIAADPRTQQSRDRHPDGSLYGVMVDRLDVAFRVLGNERAVVEAVDLWDGATPRAPLRTKEWLARLQQVHGVRMGES